MRLVRRYSMAQGLAGALGAGGRAPSGVLEVLARYPIARGQSLVLLRLDRRVLLCCHTRGGKFGVGGGMTVLTELTEPEDVAAILIKTRDSASESIARRFQSILSRSEHDADRVLSHAEASGSTPRRRTTAPEAPRALPRGEAGRAAAYGLDVAVRAPSGADAADAIRRRLAAMRAQGVTAFLLTVISLVPSIMLMTTCFMRIIIVLGLLKQAMGTQTIPPPQVVTGAGALHDDAGDGADARAHLRRSDRQPYQRGEIVRPRRAVEPGQAADPGLHVRPDRRDQQLVERVHGAQLPRRGHQRPEKLTRADVDMVTLVPAYMLSELKTAFLMGFRVYLPFLVIDMVISSMLISMSMMMLPPVLISLPFKLLLFVLVDGWQLVVGGLMSSFGVAGGRPRSRLRMCSRSCTRSRPALCEPPRGLYRCPTTKSAWNWCARRSSSP
jgi:flagellar biosynthetic protein FliP